MFNRFIFLLFLPAIAQAQSRKNEFNIYREAGLTANNEAYGIHYSWQAQISKTLYLGAGVEAMRSVVNEKETVRKEKIAAASFRLSYMSDLEGLRLVPYISPGVVLSQPTGTVLDCGLGMAAGKWQLSAAYRQYNTSREQPGISNGLFLRLSLLLVKEATRPRFE
jgi:hypothetical protein